MRCPKVNKTLDLLNQFIPEARDDSEVIIITHIATTLISTESENEKIAQLNKLLKSAAKDTYITATKVLLEHTKIDIKGLAEDKLNEYTILFICKTLNKIGKIITSREIEKTTNGYAKALNSIKVFAHRFAIEGKFDLKTSHDYSGHMSLYTYPELTRSLRRYLSENENKTGLNENEQKEIIDAFNAIGAETTFKNLLERYQHNKLLVIPSGWYGHATSLVLKNETLLKCNKGKYRKEFALSEYKITIPQNITFDFIKSITRLGVIALLNPEYFNTIIDTKLGLQFKREGSFQTHNQKVGNCTWASAKLAFRGALYLTYLEKGYSLQKAKEKTEEVFKDWRAFDLKMGVQSYLDEHKEGEPLHALIDKELLKLIWNKCADKEVELFRDFPHQAKVYGEIQGIIEPLIPSSSFSLN